MGKAPTNRIVMKVEIKENGDIGKIMEMLKAVGFDPQIKEIRSLKMDQQSQEPRR
jgi:hypothetical protein